MKRNDDMESIRHYAKLVERGRNSFHGGPYEIWDIGDGQGIYVDFCQNPQHTGRPETMAFLVLGRWYEDATGGKAIRELGYEPVEENENPTKTLNGDE